MAYIALMFLTYLIAAYAEDTKTAHACEGSTMSLSCRPDNKIEILQVIYRYPDRRQCENSELPMTCVSYDKSKVAKRCLGQSHCDFTIDTNLLEMKCKRPTVRHATVLYKCKPK